jgi:hypothetical protein
MDRLSYDREERAERAPRPPEPAPPPVQAGSLAWASAVGNQAVQRLARQQVARQPDDELEEAPPPEVEALSAAGIGPTEVAGLAALDDLAEDELPE